MNVPPGFESALQAFHRGLHRKALGAFNRLSQGRLSENDRRMVEQLTLECHKLLGLRFIAQDLTQQAETLFDQALAQFPGHPALSFYRAVAIHNGGNPAAASVDFDHLADAVPDFPALPLARATARLNQGLGAECIRLALAAAAIPPLDALLLHLRGVAHFRLHQMDSALVCLEQALERGDSFVDGQVSLLCLQIWRGHHGEARRVLDGLLPAVRDRRPLAPVLAFLGVPQKGVRAAPPPDETTVRLWAKAHFERFRTIDVRTLPFLGEEGDLVRHGWFRNLLIAHYQSRLGQGVAHPDLLFQLGREFQRMRRPAVAAGYFRQCLELNPYFLPARISLAFACREMGRRAEAIAGFEQLLTDLRDHPGLVLQTGQARLGSDTAPGTPEELREELRLLRLAVTRNPEFADLHYNIGRVLFQLDEPEAALASFERAAAQNPGFVRVALGRSLALLQLNRPAEARQILDGITVRQDLGDKAAYTLALLHLDSGSPAQARPLLEALVDRGGVFAAQATELLAGL